MFKSLRLRKLGEKKEYDIPLPLFSAIVQVIDAYKKNDKYLHLYMTNLEEWMRVYFESIMKTDIVKLLVDERE